MEFVAKVFFDMFGLESRDHSRLVTHKHTIYYHGIDGERTFGTNVSTFIVD